MTNEQTQKLAERIALLLQEETPASDFNSLRTSVERISERLDKIENQSINTNPKSQIPNPKSNHSSQERFAIAEIVADEIIENLEKEKACPYEPTGKPCDHCAMCSSRGF
ncbi:MAG TPA: hypothetical protein VK892_05055 [Pyrinomonadaceae bacterium]|nr:hypothetical protein [Pyrinomonadaceae bacterium]